MTKPKTMGELEAEDQGGFRNASQTVAEQVQSARLTAARREHEATHTPIADPFEDDDDDDENENEDEDGEEA